MLKKNIILLISFISIQMFFGCSSISTKESKITAKEAFWTDSDSEMISDSLVNGLLKSEWITEFSKNRKSVIVVGEIENFTNEQIEANSIEKNIERSLINSGKVTFISSKAQREEIRNNRKKSSEFKNKNEFKNYLKSLKSDFFIDGKLELKMDSLSTPRVKEYILFIQVIDSKNTNVVNSKNISIIK